MNEHETDWMIDNSDNDTCHCLYCGEVETECVCFDEAPLDTDNASGYSWIGQETILPAKITRR